MKILVTYAVQGEFTELKFPGLIGEEEVQVGYLRTGIGKVKSAFTLRKRLIVRSPIWLSMWARQELSAIRWGYFCMPSFCRP